MKKYIELLKKTFKRWLANDPFKESAVIAYYTLFSLPSLLVIVIAVAGYFFDNSTVQDEIISQLAVVIGEDTAGSLEKLLLNVKIQDNSVTALIISIGVMVYGATGAFLQLKKAMNKIWSVDAKKSNFVMTLLNRLFSLGMILLIGLMLVVSLLATTVINSFQGFIEEYIGEISISLLSILNFLISFVFVTFLVAAIFKLLPDIRVRWKVVFVGAALSTLLLLIAEIGLGYYFSISNPASVFGGASSVILIMLWIYYACLVLFLGAEFTVQYALFKNEKIKPGRYGQPAYINKIEELKKRETGFVEEVDLFLGSSEGGNKEK